jgi:F0F1-type ATP synthase assembly protein I
MPEGQDGKSPVDWVRQIAVAFDLPFMLIGGVIGGGLAGYLLDRWLHTSPWLMMVFGLLGFFGGLVAVLQTLGQHRGTGNGNKR